MAPRNIVACALLTLSGIVAGWMLRSSQLNDDYQPYAPTHRPASVSKNAQWFGGQDGGAYVRCYLHAEEDVDECKVWNDNTGALGESGKYKLAKENRAATEDELIVSFPDFGGSIYLENGLVLKHQSVTPQTPVR